MLNRAQVLPPLRWRCMLAAVLISLASLAAHAADTPGATTGPAASDSSVKEAILKELKAIRQVLEKIQKQALAGGKERAARPTTATVAISNKPTMGSDRHLAAIDQDARDANAARLTGTPSFIIGKTASDKITGQLIIGAQPLNKLTAAIEKALGGVDKARPATAGKKAPDAG